MARPRRLAWRSEGGDWALSAGRTGRFLRSFYRPARGAGSETEEGHEGLCEEEGDRWYAVIYEGVDPATGESDGAGILPGLSELTPSGSQQSWRRGRTAAKRRHAP